MAAWGGGGAGTAVVIVFDVVLDKRESLEMRAYGEAAAREGSFKCMLTQGPNRHP